MLFSWLCHSIWLLFIYNMLKLPVFLSHFADGLHDWRHFIGYSFGISRNNVSTVFYGTAFLEIFKGSTIRIPLKPPTGKLEKKTVFSPYCGDEKNHIYDRPRIFLLQRLLLEQASFAVPFFKPRAGMNSFHSLFKTLLRTDFFPSSLFQHLSLERFFP